MSSKKVKRGREMTKKRKRWTTTELRSKRNKGNTKEKEARK